MKKPTKGYLECFGDWKIPVAETEEELQRPCKILLELKDGWYVEILNPEDLSYINGKIFVGEEDWSERVMGVSYVMPQPSHKLAFQILKKKKVMDV